MAKRSQYLFLIKCSIICSIFFLGVGCTRPNDNANLQQEGFEIHVIEFAHRKTLGVDTFESIIQNDLSVISEDILKQADLIIKEDDIIIYDWTTQTITLSDDFREQYLSDDPILSDFSLFVITFQGKSLVSGRILNQFSPLHQETPTLYVSSPLVDSEDIGLNILLRPESFKRNTEDLETVFPIDDEILIEQIRQHFQVMGKLFE